MGLSDMVNWEVYADMVAAAGGVLEICMTGCLFWRFAKPFLPGNKRTEMVGVTYALVMLVLKFCPLEMDNKICGGIGVLSVFIVMYWIDRRNTKQKLFLALTFYLLEWIAWGVILGPWSSVYHMLVMRPFIAERDALQFVLWVIMEIVFVAMNVSVKAFLIWVLHQNYRYKRENMTKGEFVLLLAPSMSVMAGYWIISYFVNIYRTDLGQDMEDVHGEYIWFRALYMAISFAALLTVIISYRHIKDGQRREKEDAVLSRQREDMKRHMEEVERLYGDIRSLKHDMANHVMVLESLYGSGIKEREEGGEAEEADRWKESAHESLKGVNRSAEAGKYMAQLRARVEEITFEIRSGNPVTDVILMEKYKEAEKKGIAFQYEFHYPEKAGVEAFDVSIILNNALNNAMEAAEECEDAFVSVRSYQTRNAWMIEVKNSAAGWRDMDEESGLPITTKKEAGHGFGIASIKKAAKKYHGDIDIMQDGREFVLSVMLMKQG